MVDLSGVDRTSIVERAKAMILTPKDEWRKIATENQSQAEIFRSYVLPLALIGPVAGLIGGQVFGYGGFGFNVRPGIISSAITAVIQYVVMLVGVFVLSFIANFLAPQFSGKASQLNAFKLVAYSATATWLAQAVGLVPQLAFFAILGLYSIYLFYLGAAPLMKVPQEKVASYVGVTFLCSLLAGFLMSLIVAPVALVFAGIAGVADDAIVPDTDKGTVTIPGVGSIDVDKAEKFSKQMEDAANGKSPPVDAAKMQELLPETIGAFKRDSMQTTAVGQLGSTAEGTYSAEGKSFTLRVADMSALGALVGLGSALGVEQSRQDADSYEKTATVDGQMQTEAWNKSTSSGKFGRTVANRFMIEAEGSANNIEELKTAVASIDQEDLTDLAQ
jgi:hypothetical protein